jgi:hypothetical protein
MKYAWMFLVLLLISGLMVSAQNGEATPEVTPEVSPEVTPESAVIPISDLMGLSIQTPMTITLPEGWDLLTRDTYIYHDVIEDGDGSSIETVPFDVYGGALSNGGTGWIVVVWGFDSLAMMSTTEQEFDQRSAWLDGLRMLQLVVFTPGCNLGTAPQRDYSVGGLPAVGTTFQAVDCPLELPDTRGWFASLKVEGLNFAFYAYADPLQAVDSGFEYELQAILDTVDFTVDEVTISQAEFQATRESFVATQLATTPTATQAP